MYIMYLYTLIVHIIVTTNYRYVSYFFRFFWGGVPKSENLKTLKKRIIVTFDENWPIS